MSIGNNIKIYRKKLGFTQEELANQLCVTSQAVSKWESEAGYPDMAQVVPLARILNISTDVLFGMNESDYDRDYAETVKSHANELRDSSDVVTGAIAAADYLDEQCDLYPYNYEILKKFVQSVAGLSRYSDKLTGNIFKEEPERWEKYRAKALNRGMQTIRYSNEPDVINEVHTAIAWIYYHEQDYDKGWEHINVLPSVSSNSLQESMNAQFTYIQKGMDAWKNVVNGNIQNYARVINRELVYAMESLMWNSNAEQTIQLMDYAKGIMQAMCKNITVKPFCQGFYRDCMKYAAGACLRENNPEKASKIWIEMKKTMEDYTDWAESLAQDEKLVIKFGEKGARNIKSYSKEYCQSKLDFMYNQLKSWCDAKVFEEFEKLI